MTGIGRLHGRNERRFSTVQRAVQIKDQEDIGWRYLLSHAADLISYRYHKQRACPRDNERDQSAGEISRTAITNNGDVPWDNEHDPSAGEISLTINTNNGDAPRDNEHDKSAGEISPTINTNNGSGLAWIRQQEVTHDVPWDNEHDPSAGEISSSENPSNPDNSQARCP